MLELVDIKKDYEVAGGKVSALKGVSIKFRKNEFVSILGPSGCGKTTLLNIVGGLDKYTSGDLVIEGRSTKEFRDGDWDTYRNHSIGFIFQSYHLIPHQTILQNVELALTISGVEKEERRRRAVDALEKVGLGDKLKNKPNQLSGGQAQRVAIARALINDPEIVLADEPTGALDSKTSVQIMELLKEIARERLVIMVTHNPELAEKYSTRIISLKDGEVLGDTDPFDGVTVRDAAPEISDGQPEEQKTNKGKKKKSSMSFPMAFKLSLKNLLSKARRTTMVSVAGSIGIIGVSMVLAISAGVQMYIKDMEDDMLSGNPVSITQEALDYNSLMDFAMTGETKIDITRLKDKVYLDSVLDSLLEMGDVTKTNNISAEYAAYIDAMPKEYYNAIRRSYNLNMADHIYTDFAVKEGDAPTKMSVTAIRQNYAAVLKKQPDYSKFASMINTVNTFGQAPNNYNYILSQYDVLASYNGKTENFTEEELKDIFESKDSLLMVVRDNGFEDMDFAQYGYMTEEELLQFAFKAAGDEYDEEVINKYAGKWNADKNEWEDGYDGLDFSYFLGENAHSFTWYGNDSIYSRMSQWEKDNIYSQAFPNSDLEYKYNHIATGAGFATDDKVELKVKVILQKKAGISYGCLNQGLYFTSALVDYTLENSETSNIVTTTKNKSSKKLDVIPYMYNFTYPNPDDKTEWLTATSMSLISGSSMSFSSMLNNIMGGGGVNEVDYSVGLDTLGGDPIPKAYAIFPINFESKDLITGYLDAWNNWCVEGGEHSFTGVDGATVTVNLAEANKITYTDNVGLIITMINTMIEMITIALVAFTALSLVVSTVMIGIITYVSVVERIKEIGILRAVGARKKDIKRLFIAETFIIGLAAGLVGIGVTYIISGILNLALGLNFGIYTIASLPIWQAGIMVAISVLLTLISGLLPASAAAKKDPVVALRTE